MPSKQAENIDGLTEGRGLASNPLSLRISLDPVDPRPCAQPVSPPGRAALLRQSNRHTSGDQLDIVGNRRGALWLIMPKGLRLPGPTSVLVG